MDQNTELKEVLIRYDKNIRTFKLKNARKIKTLGSGKNGIVNLIKFNKKNMIVKVQENWKDAPHFIKNTTRFICSNTHINELIISVIINKFLTNLNIQRFYGYELTTKKLMIYKEYIPFEFLNYLTDSCIESETKTIMFINILFVLFNMFQSKTIKGFHGDLKPNNIMLRKTNKKINEITINGKIYQVPIIDYIPVLIDYGSSYIFKIGNKNTCIKRFNGDYYKEKIHNCDEIIKFNYYYDLEIFYMKLTRYKNKKYYKYIPKDFITVLKNIYQNEGPEKLTVKNIINHKLLKKYVS